MVFEPKGVIPAIVTPFKDDETLNLEALRQVTRFILEARVHGIFAVGSQGEFWTLSKEEKRKVLETVIDEVGSRVPVYAGTGAESTWETLELTRMAKDIGCDAASIITPYYVAPKASELFNHYKTIASKVDMPIVLYNNPDRTGVNIAPEVIEKLVDECSNVVGIKDSSGNLTLTTEYIEKGGERFSVLAGRDTLILATLMSGGKGCIAATANVVPKIVVRIYESFMAGDMKAALEAQRKLNPLRRAFALSTFPVVIKEAMNMIGMPAGPCRGPVGPMDADAKEKLRAILKGYGLL